MLLPHAAFVVVVDGEKVDLYRNSGNEAAPVLAPLSAPKFDHHNKDAGARRHSRSANPDARQLEEDAHAASVANWLNAQVLAHKIESLVVIAPPRTLGEMRRRYEKQLEAVLVGELGKELTGRTGPDILAALQAP